MPTKTKTRDPQALPRRKVLVIAPHADDETLGCWSVINDPNVDLTFVWFFDLTMNRIAEASSVADALGAGSLMPVRPNTDDEAAWIRKYVDNLVTVHKFDEVYVPSLRDWHPQHKLVNRATRQHATHFYSVDMKGGVPLGVEASKAKLDFLNQHYPSQADLWASNGLYYLFESIHKVDYTEFRVIASGGLVLYYTEQDEGAVQQFLPSFYSSEDTTLLFNRILSVVKGPVRLETPYVSLESPQ